MSIQLNVNVIMFLSKAQPKRSERTTLYFRWVAGQGYRPLQNGIPANRFMQVSIRHSWAYLSRGVYGLKNAHSAGLVFWPILVVYVR
jgi:hypothetical protein